MLSKVFPKGQDKVKAYICGPPPQVKALAGPKDGPRQGELLGECFQLSYALRIVQEIEYKLTLQGLSRI